MTHHWDEFSKSLAQPLPRRESLRRLGIALAGAVLSPLGLQTASAGHHPKQQQDPCKSFCKCRNKKQQNACLAACKACGNDPRFLCGSCSGGYACTDLANDPYNCGACGSACDQAGSYEYEVCVSGECDYFCIEGADRCDGTCTFLGWDPNHCGACGNICPESAPYCNQGECSGCPPGTALCGGQCVNLLSDPNNCGACGNVCGGSTPNCSQGACVGGCQGYCPERWCGGDGCGGVCACPSGTYCESDGWCYDACVFPFILCGGVCVDPTSDRYNCGGCGIQCASDEACISGFCVSG
jgi:hypothetical protein